MSIVSALERLSGDGMESCVNEWGEQVQNQKVVKNSYPSVGFDDNSDSKIKAKLKEPKFVPYEPYKAAVTPMVLPIKHGSSKSLAQCKPLKGICGKRHGSLTKKTMPIDELQLKPCKCVVENQKLEEELMQVRKDNEALENQLKMQTQVNKELKHLLVASVGEDIQTKVQFLTEDKTKLAHDIIAYTEKLMEETEAIEKLSIQCDVWRSKYLASSLIVDELAGWKAVLGHHLNEAVETVKCLIHENEILKARYNTLSYITSKYDKLSIGVQQDNDSGKNIIFSSEIDELVLRFNKLISLSEFQNNGKDVKSSKGEQLASKLLTQTSILSKMNEGSLPLENWHSFNGRFNITSRFHPCTRFEGFTYHCCHCKGEVKIL